MEILKILLVHIVLFLTLISTKIQLYYELNIVNIYLNANV